MRSTPAWGFPCCIGLPLVYMPPPLPRQNLKECSSLRFLAIAAFPGLITGRLLRLHFGACSAFTRVAACILAGSLNDPFHRRLQPFRYLHGCSDCYRLERKLPGGIRTRWKTVHWHGAHETPVDVQTHDGSGSNHQAYLWQYGTPGGMTVFDFQMSRKREGPFNILGNFEGLLQTDGYAAYDRVGGPKMVHAACWSHCRRYFVDAIKLNKQDAASIRAVELINELFAIDAQARNENMDHAARHALRHEKAPPLLTRIRTHLQEMRKTVLPKSAAGEGCTYTLGIWERLIRFLDYPELELSTNIAENSMRPIAVGRGNWIHIGSEQAGPRVAAIVSVIESCRRLKIPVRNYLADILPGLANAPLQRIADLTPAAWAAKHPQMIRHALV
jgi:hypothetical protein